VSPRQRIGVGLAIVGFTIVLFIVARPETERPAPPLPPPPVEKSVGAAPAIPAPPAPALPAASAAAAISANHPPDFHPPSPATSLAVTPLTPQIRAEVEVELDQVQTAIRSFRTELGGIPVGTNAEITRELFGDNPKQVKVPLPTGSRLNGAGELCDRWDTPYFFHQLSSARMEIRSAGPDRRMWTDDDLEIK
jgi:hypothetical protein